MYHRSRFNSYRGLNELFQMEARQDTAVIKYGILCSLKIILCGSGKEPFTDFFVLFLFFKFVC